MIVAPISFSSPLSLIMGFLLLDPLLLLGKLTLPGHFCYSSRSAFTCRTKLVVCSLCEFKACNNCV